MKFKKLTAIFLAIIMVCMSMSFVPTSAETTAVCKIIPPEGSSFPGGTVTEFATLDAAVAAINSLAMDGITIKMTAPTAPKWTTNAYVMRYYFIFDGEYAPGQRATISDCSNYWLDLYDGATIKNVNISATHGVRYRNNNSDNPLTFENVTYTLKAGMLVNVQGETANNTQTVNLINCNISKASTVTTEPIMAVYGSNNRNVIVNIHNTEISQNGGANNNSNGSMLYAYGAPATVNITGNSRLNYNGVGASQTSMFNAAKTITVNIGSSTDNGSGVIMNLGPAENVAASPAVTTAGRSFFTNTNYAINDKGATWMVHPTVAATGFKMPNQSGYSAYETTEGYTVRTEQVVRSVGAEYADKSLVMKHTTNNTVSGDVETKMHGGVVAKIGSTTYSALDTALKAGGTVEMITNARVAATTLTNDFVLNGNGNAILSDAGYIFDIRGNSTMNDVTMYGKIGTRLNPLNKDQVMTNVYRNCVITNTGSNLTYNVQGSEYVASAAKLHTVLFENCEFNHYSIDNFMLVHREKKLADITLKDTTVNFTSTKDFIFNLCVEGTLDFKLEGSTVINNYSSHGNTGIFYVHDWKQGDDGDCQTATVTLGSEVLLNIAPTSGGNARFVYDTEGTNPVTLVDNGATWQVSEGLASKGFKFGLPNTAIIAFETEDGGFYNPSDVITTGDALSFKSVPAIGTLVENGIGASIRTTDPDGIRFATSVNKDAYEALGESIQFGAIVTTKDVIDGLGGDFSALDETNSVKTSDNLNWKEEGEVFYTVLTGITAEDYKTVYAATGFATIRYTDGSSITVYANYSDGANARSIYYVASEALKDTRYSYTAAQLDYLNLIVQAAEAGSAN